MTETTATEAIELFSLEDLAKDYINYSRNTPYSPRSLRNWADAIGLNVLGNSVNQHGAVLLDKYYHEVVSIKGSRQQKKALDDFIRRRGQLVRTANELMATPGRYAQPAEPFHDSFHESFHETDREMNGEEATDSAISLVQGGVEALQAQTQQAAKNYVQAVEDCADAFFETVQATPDIFMNRLATRAKESPNLPKLADLLSPKPPSRRLPGS